MTTSTNITQCTRCSVWGTSEHQCAVREAPAVTVVAADDALPYVGHRRDDRVLRDPSVDLELLAKYLSTFQGEALNPEPTVPSGQTVDGRTDYLDEHNADIYDAGRVIRRLAVVPDADRLVLILAFLLNGQESRAQWKGGFDSRIGFVFAPLEKQQRWVSDPRVSVATDLATALGSELRERATLAYAGIEDEPPATDGRWLFPMIDAVYVMVKVADSILHSVVSTGRTKVVSNPKERNRESRRKALQKKVDKENKVDSSDSCDNQDSG